MGDLLSGLVSENRLRMGKMGILAWTKRSLSTIIAISDSVDRGAKKSVLMGRLLEPYKAYCALNRDATCGRGVAQSVFISK